MIHNNENIHNEDITPNLILIISIIKKKSFEKDFEYEYWFKFLFHVSQISMTRLIFMLKFVDD